MDEQADVPPLALWAKVYTRAELISVCHVDCAEIGAFL